MQLARRHHRGCSSSRSSRSTSTSSGRPGLLHVRAQAPLTGSTGAASSNAASKLAAPLSVDRPAGGGSRSFDLPRSSDAGAWAPRSDLLRPSGGASRGAAFATGGDGAAASGSIDRPGGRGGRSDLPSGWDLPAPTDPASGRPGGRGGRDLDLSSSGGGGGASGPVSPLIDRPGGRGGRGDVGGGSGGSGGSGGGGDASSGGGGGGGAGKAVGSVALYAGVIAAAWFGHQAFFAEKQPAAPVKPCCAGKKGGKK